MQNDRAVHRSFDDAIVNLHDVTMSRTEPFTFNRRGDANEISGDFEDHEELSLVIVDLTCQRGTSAGGEQQPRRIGFASDGDAIRIAGQECATERVFVDVLAVLGAEEAASDRSEVALFRGRAAREAYANLDRLGRAMCVEYDACEPRMEREALQFVKIAKLCEQLGGGVDALLRRTLEPLERARVAAPGDDVEDDRREIDAPNLRFAMRAQNVAQVPQTNGPSGR